MAERTNLGNVMERHEDKILEEWIEESRKAGGSKNATEDTKNLYKEFLRLLIGAVKENVGDSIRGKNWDGVRGLLNGLSKSRSQQGYSPSETAMFVLSLKRPVFNLLRKELGSKPEEFANENWNTNMILDQLGLYTMENYQKSREELIARQQEEMLELSTPVVKLWDGILALPMIGTLDSSRTQVVMESLLQKIMETGSEVAIIDITGVPTVDTLVAQHLIKTVTAARLMGADCIISGIRPQIAATIVHLGVDLGNVSTKASLADAFVLALKKTGKTIGKTNGHGSAAGRDIGV